MNAAVDMLRQGYRLRLNDALQDAINRARQMQICDREFIAVVLTALADSAALVIASGPAVAREALCDELSAEVMRRVVKHGELPA